MDADLVEHDTVAERLGIFDLERGAKVAGAAFPAYRADGAALIRALINLFLDTHVRENGFTEIWPPVLINEASARGTGQIPDKEDQMYVVGRDGFFLAPTAEVPVTNIHRDEIIEADRLPIDAAYLSVPRPIEFPTEGNRTAFAFHYPPANPDFAAPAGELPPLIVLSHGGPTAATDTALGASQGQGGRQ